jgi:hypothetical protein
MENVSFRQGRNRYLTGNAGGLVYTEERIGQAFVKLWDILHEIHREHLGIIQTSNGGAAHGLHKCIRFEGKMVICPPVYRSSIHSLVEISGGFLLVKEPLPTEEDLYTS